MRSALKHMAKVALTKFGIGITRHASLVQLLENSSTTDRKINLILELPELDSWNLLRALRSSTSQLGQDLFVLSEMAFKRGGFFVEFGAANGIDLSNTLLLEKGFEWTGILAEPGKRWHGDLKRNRNSHIETDCVWRDSHSVLTFNEIAEHSTIDAYSSSDRFSKAREHGNRYTVNTISLEDMLDKYHAPRKIDYLSIDTEGSEYEILSNFDFDKYHIGIITCEHNFTPEREKIFSLLAKNGYVRKLSNISQYDDWFVKID